MKRWILIVSVAIAVIAVAINTLIQSTPHYSSYEKQKQHAVDLAQKAWENRTIAMYMPAEIVGRVVDLVYTNPARHKTVAAYRALFKRFPIEANDDVDALRGMGDALFNINKSLEAITYHQKNLDVFKKKFFHKEYDLRMNVEPMLAKRQEYLYVAEQHWKIAACYNRLKQYEMAITEYEKILAYMPETKDLKEADRFMIFEGAFVSIGKAYKVILRDYNKAFSIYETMKREFPKEGALSADLFIGDTYLAKGEIGRAQDCYQLAVQNYEHPLNILAKDRLKDMKEGLVVGADGVSYKIENGSVSIRLI